MRFLRIFAAASLLSLSCALAQVPPAEQLLPDDVIGLATVPDWNKLAGSYSNSSWGQLWVDAAMKPFRDNFSSNFQADFVKPLEKQLGLKLSDYQELLQGQVTIAFTPPPAGSKQFVNFLVLVDAKDKTESLKTKLTDLKKKWTDAGKEVKTEKIRDVEFSSIMVTSADLKALLKKAFPASEEEPEPDEKTPPEKLQLRIGQYKSLLILGEDEKVIEKILARQGGGLVPPLAERANYQKTHTALFRDSQAYAWVNFKPIYTKILALAAAEKQEPAPGMPALQMEKILPALGFASLDSVAAKVNSNAEGNFFEFFAGTPDAQREGLLKVFALEKKDAAPPGFVPADVLQFQRTRLDLPKAWATLENMLGKIDPSIAGLVELMLSTAGKDKDPNFDLKKNLISNLGDDVIQYAKAPKPGKPSEPQMQPAMLLIGSPNPAQLLDALRLLTSMMPPPLSSAPIKEREFLGKKIYSLTMSTPAEEAGGPDDKEASVPTATLNFCASAGYVAFSADNTIIEEFIRSGETPPKALRGLPGLTEAAQKIGGFENGLFTYDNTAETLRLKMEALKNYPEGFNQSLFFGISGGEEEGAGAFKRLFDVKLLPAYDRIAKYFGMALFSGTTTSDGYSIKAFTPTPSGVKK